MGEENVSLGSARYLYETRDMSFDIVNDFPWTVSRNRDVLQEVPYIFLREYEIDESVIQQQISFYATGIQDALQGNEKDPLAPYRKLFPRNSTGNTYKFPFFDDVNFKLETPVWPALDAIESGKKAAVGLGQLLGGDAGGQFASNLVDAVGTAVTVGAAAKYPKVGIMDRPRLFERHEFRTTQVKFPLFNTLGPEDWERNRSFCWIFLNQNLFRKRDFITGIPPVYYELLIPGQHYSYASCVTDIAVYNRGNMRRITRENKSDAIVPDVYEINITLTDMVMPSRNLFQMIQTQQETIIVNTPQGAPPEAPNVLNSIGKRVVGGLAAAADTATTGLATGLGNTNRFLAGGVQE